MVPDESFEPSKKGVHQMLEDMADWEVREAMRKMKRHAENAVEKADRSNFCDPEIGNALMVYFSECVQEEVGSLLAFEDKVRKAREAKGR